MNIDKSKVMITTNKFEEIKKEFNRDYNEPASMCFSATDIKMIAIKKAMDELLELLSEMVMEDE